MSDAPDLQLPPGPIVLNLDGLVERIPAVPSVAGAFFALACRVCLDSQGHGSGVALQTEMPHGSETMQLHWQESVTERDRRGMQDERKTTDFGACAIAFLFVDRYTDYTPYEQSATGDTIDYYLAPKAALPQLLQEDTLIFNSPGEYPIAYLEASGIRCENEGNTIADRLGSKKRRLKTPHDLPTFIAVVEFSRPRAKMIKV